MKGRTKYLDVGGCKLVLNWMYPLVFLSHTTINHSWDLVEALCDVLKRPGKPIGHAVPAPISSRMPPSLRWTALNITLGCKVNHTWHFLRQVCACAWGCTMQQRTWRLGWIESNGQQMNPDANQLKWQYMHTAYQYYEKHHVACEV